MLNLPIVVLYLYLYLVLITFTHRAESRRCCCLCVSGHTGSRQCDTNRIESSREPANLIIMPAPNMICLPSIVGGERRYASEISPVLSLLFGCSVYASASASISVALSVSAALLPSEYQCVCDCIGAPLEWILFVFVKLVVCVSRMRRQRSRKINYPNTIESTVPIATPAPRQLGERQPSAAGRQ